MVTNEQLGVVVRRFIELQGEEQGYTRTIDGERYENGFLDSLQLDIIEQLAQNVGVWNE